MPSAAAPADPPEYPARPELALSALLYLLTRFTLHPCAAKADSILSHLRLIAADARHPEALRQTAARLAGEWRGIASEGGGGPLH